MRDWTARLLLVAFCCGVPIGLWMMLTGSRGQQLVYPAFSSLRSDEKGTSIWYESLSQDDRMQTSQNFRPLAQMHWRNTAVLVLGVALRDWGGGLDKLLSTCEAAAGAGNRVVVTLDPENTPKFWRLPEAMDVFKKRDLHPVWQKDTLLLKPGSSWKLLSSNSKGVEAIERGVGKGMLVFASSSSPVSNRGLARQRDTALLLALMGTPRLVVFDESHLGVIETGTVLGLARHYRLQGLFAGLLALCILFVWRSSSAFPPRPPGDGVTKLQNPLDGFAALLQRSLPQDQLMEECSRARKQVEHHAQRRETLDERAQVGSRHRRYAGGVSADAGEHGQQTTWQQKKAHQNNNMTDELEQLQEALRRLRAEVAKVIIGQEAAIRDALIVLLTGQHALIEGVPGLGKTLLVRTLAQAFSSPFARIQFTPDLMPADITGTNIFNLQRNEFVLAPGPVFTTFLLADEVNRAPAKTQSALLEAMQERTVSIDRETHRLSANFTVFATQNPSEFEGTYALPEAQKDRFMLRIGMTWPEREEELLLADRMLQGAAPEKALASDVVAVMPLAEFAERRRALDSVAFRPELLEYLVDVVRSTRTHESVLLGAGPRATQAVTLASRAYALYEGRDFVTPDDIRTMALPVLEHRLLLRPETEIEGIAVSEVVTEILREHPVPR